MKTNLIGKRFGKLQVIAFSHSDKYRHTHWLCKCDCGKTSNPASRQLLSKGITSCGCIRIIKGNKNKLWQGYGEVSQYLFNKVRHGAKRRNLEFKINKQQCWNLFIAQDRKCKLSGLPLVFPSSIKSLDGTASLDRIDSNKGYTLDNIQWVHKDINQMKMDLDQTYFINLVTLVAKHNGGMV